MIKRLVSSALLAVTVSSFATAAGAAGVTPISAIGSSSFGGYEDFNAVDTGANRAVTDWSSLSEGTASFLNLDLGAVYTLGSASVTDRVTSGSSNGSFVGGTTDFTTKYSLTGYTDATFTTVIGSAFVKSNMTPVSPTTPSDFASTINLTGLTARYVRYNVLEANGGNVGISDITFNTVPEPASWALMIIGFGMVGVAARRRVATVAA